MIRLLTVIVFMAITGCSIEPEPIAYGKDMCHFCTMTIVDDQHASEMVTSKGKSYKYDAIECMINDLGKNDYGEISFILVSDYSYPGKLIDADKATFLVSPEIPSPMGAYLSAFSENFEAEKRQKNADDHIYTWEKIKSELAP